MATHPTAIIQPGAEIDPSAEIGPYCIIGPHVKIGANTRLIAHVFVDNDTTLGVGNVVHPFAALGGPPQDLKFKGEQTRLTIGADNTFREFVTINRGTAGGGGETTIGDSNFFMAYSHVAHDCHVGSQTIFANAATLAGHVTVEDDATIGAFSGVHQFCRVGRHGFIGGYTVVTQDALPFVKTVGNRAEAFGINTIGLERKGFSPDALSALRKAYRILFQSKLNTGQATERIEAELSEYEECRYLVSFIRASTRGIVK